MRGMLWSRMPFRRFSAHRVRIARGLFIEELADSCERIKEDGVGFA